MSNTTKEQNIQTLVEFFKAGCKEDASIRMGLEVEHFAVYKKDHTSTNYYGENGMGILLKEMNTIIDGEGIYSDEDLLGISCPDYTVTIEPAAQLEISIRPCETLEEIRSIYAGFRAITDAVLEKHGLELCTLGYHPVSCVEDLPLIPKKRYAYMDAYFRRSGTKGINMMRGTASTQISIDYQNERDFVRKFRLASILSPLIKLWTDNTPFFEGRPVTRLLERTHIWEDVDPKRTGVFPALNSPDFGFRAYAEYLWNVPLILKMEGHEAICTEDLTTGEVYENTIIGKEEAEHIVSMVFPDVRLKKFVEIRMGDSMDEENVLAYAAFIKGIYGSEKQIDMLVDRFSCDPDVIGAAERSVMESGFSGQAYGMPVKTLAKELLDLAAQNLNEDERNALKPFYERTEKETTLTIEYLKKAGICCASDSDAACKKQADCGLELSQKWQAWCETHEDELKDWADKAEDYLKHCPEVNHGRYLHQLAIPKFYSAGTIQKFQRISEETYALLCRVTQEYLDNAAYRKHFPFSSELEELILVPRGYETMIPMARYDLFYNEETGDYKFCEINTDGTSAMNEDVECYRTLLSSPAYAEFQKEYEMTPFELFDSWVAAFAETYATYEKRVEAPHVAILDFMEEACSYEFTIFRDRFRAAGFDTEIYEIRELRYEDGKLLSPDGKQIHAVYRRAVTGDIEKYREEVPAFLQAVKEGAVCLIGALCTQVVHHKSIFKVLHEEATMAFLTEEQQEFVKKHIPGTYDLTAAICEKYRILENKDKWIIKPYDSYGSRGVTAGCDVSDEEWKQVVAEALDAGFIVQEYCLPYQAPNRYVQQDAAFKLYNNMPGLYVYNGKFAGIYSRYSDGGIISSVTNKRVTTTLLAERR